MNSRAKGVRGELAVAHLFQKYGYKAERGQQHDGMSGHADVVGVPYLWIEAKWREELNLEQAMQQAERDCSELRRQGEDSLPVVVHKKNRQKWSVTMRLYDLISMTGAAPFSSLVPTDGLVTMDWDDWIRVYMAYEQERSAA